MIILLQLTRTGISFYYHLVEVKGNTETPEEVGEQEVVDEGAHGDADVGPVDEVLGDAKGGVAEKDGCAEVHDEFDGVGTNAGEDGEGDNGYEG